MNPNDFNNWRICRYSCFHGKFQMLYYSMILLFADFFSIICHNVINLSLVLNLQSMIEYKVDAPLKIFIEDLRNFQKLDTNWNYKISETATLNNITKVFIQGEIIKTAGFSKEILILDDRTGKIKVTKNSHVPGDLSWVNDGVYCSIVGTLLENGKLPLLSADKIAKLDNPILQKMWPLEVKELKGVLTRTIIPKLPEN